MFEVAGLVFLLCVIVGIASACWFNRDGQGWDWGFFGFAVGFCFGLGFSLLVGVIYVVAHFLSKIW